MIYHFVDLLLFGFAVNMAGKFGDSDENRLMDRIKAVAFREAMEAGASFINRELIATKLQRPTRWVTAVRNRAICQSSRIISRGLGSGEK